MTIQHIELRGEHYVIVSERDFLELQQQRSQAPVRLPAKPATAAPRFREVVPLPVPGMPASAMLIQDRR